MSAKSNYLENKIIDWLFRGQAFTPPATLYFALFTAGADEAGTATEVSTSGSGYARVGLAASMSNFAGTQGAGTTTASTGTGGTTSNNVAIQYGSPAANWGSIVGMGVYDSATGGNMLTYGALQTPKTVNAGDSAPSFAAGDFTFQEDN